MSGGRHRAAEHLSARLSGSSILLSGALVFAALSAWAVHHVVALEAVLTGHSSIAFRWVFVFTFVMLAWQLGLCYFERPRRGAYNDADHVVVLVPAYNEDPALLRECLSSFLRQTRLPNEVHVVDDGSTTGAYEEVRDWFYGAALNHGVYPRWIRTPNGGKRHAQSVGVADSPEATIYVTVDSDAVLDAHALEEGLKPFEDPEVQSVAGVVLAHNNRKNLLARMTDLWFVTGQFMDRSSMSAAGSVLVNSGSLALYRAEILRDNMDGYLNETFLGTPVPFSDDSMLTLYARLRGKTVQQPTAFSFSMMPERLSHHFRQQLRWMRGSFIRSWWRAKYLPMTGYAYWLHMMRWVQFAVSSSVFVVLCVVQPAYDHRVVFGVMIIPVLIGYGQSLRYLSFRRSDESRLSQVATVLLSPLVSLWVFVVLRPLRWYAMLTCMKTDWNTRQAVEVGLATSRLSLDGEVAAA